MEQCFVLYIARSIYYSFPGGSDSNESACDVGGQGLISGSGRSLEKGMATYSSTLAWRISWTEEPGRLQSMWLQRVRHDIYVSYFHFSVLNTWILCIFMLYFIFIYQCIFASFVKLNYFQSEFSGQITAILFFNISFIFDTYQLTSS